MPKQTLPSHDVQYLSDFLRQLQQRNFLLTRRSSLYKRATLAWRAFSRNTGKLSKKRLLIIFLRAFKDIESRLQSLTCLRPFLPVLLHDEETETCAGCLSELLVSFRQSEFSDNENEQLLIDIFMRAPALQECAL